MKGSSDTRKTILDAAARLFAEHGFDGTSVRDIVKAAGVNLGAVTYHFGTKESLFSEVVSQKIRPLKRLVEEVYEGPGDPEGKLQRIFEIYAMYILHDAPDLKVFFTETLAGGNRLPPLAREGVAWRNRIFSEMVEEGVKGGVFRKCDTEVLAWSFFGMLSAFILYEPLALRGKRRGAFPKREVRRVVKAALDVFMNGLHVPCATKGRTGRRVKK